MEPTSRRRFVAAAGVALTGLSGCVGGSSLEAGNDGGEQGNRRDGGTGRQETTTREPTMQGVPVASEVLPVEYEFETLRDEVQSGGPPKDGIPSVDDPKFWSADEADGELRDADVVFGLVRNGEVKAYPQKVLVWHEIVNDVVGDEPVSVTYCPLTGTAMGFRRGETTFGVSGDLLNNNLVMYDRATDSRWPQMLGTSITGELEGESLQEFRLVWTTWKRWKQAHPDTRVLSEDTGHVRNYDRDPYGSYVPEPSGYYTRESTLFPPLGRDDRLPNKAVVVGTRTAGPRFAVEEAALRERGLLAGTVGSDGGPAYVAVHDPVLDAAYVYRNPEDASFDYDAENGRAVADDGTAYDPAELPLDRVYAFDAMWFAWSGFYPSTEVVTG